MEQNFFEINTCVVEENDDVRTELTWKFKNFQSILTDKTFKEVTTGLLQPHASCKCDKFRHPKNIRLKLRLCENKIKKFDLYFTCEPILPLQSYVTYGYSVSCTDENKNDIITEHFKSGWQLLRTILVDNRNVFMSIVIHFRVIKALLLDPIRQFEIRKSSSMVGVCNDMLELLKEGTDSDVTLLSQEGMPFKAHKLILANRSKVLKAMFKHDKSNVITTAYKENVLSEILSYIYAGRAPMIEEMAHELMAAADYYELAGLKTACAETLREQLTPDNAIETLELAETYNCIGLVELTLQYIKDGHIDLVIKTEGWNNITSLNLIKRMLEVIHETCGPVPCTK